MKIIVKETYNEWVNPGRYRSSDGSYHSSEITRSVNVYANSECISVITARTIDNFVNNHTSRESDKVWDSSYEGEFTEKFSLDLTKKLIDILGNKTSIEPEEPEECDTLLNSIATETCKKHLASVSDWRKEKLNIDNKYLLESKQSKARFAIKSFYENEKYYLVNSKMPDFDEFLLDFAMNADNIDYLDYLISIGANTVSNVDSFTLWLCEKGKFEYIDLFMGLEKVNINEKGYGDEFSINFLLNTIVHNRPELYFKYGKLPDGKYAKTLCKNRFSDSFSTSIGQVALKQSSNATIKALADKNIEFFYLRWSKELEEGCFKNIELTDLFLKKAPTDSLYTLFKVGRTDFIKELIEMNCFDFREVELSKFRQFFKPENDYIIKSLAAKTTRCLTKRIYEPRETSSYFPMEHFMVDSVIEIYIKQHRFQFAKQLFELSNKNEKVTSYDAGRLLFMLCKYDVELESNDFKELLCEYITEDDLTKLMSISFFENNPNLLKFIVPKVKDVNSPIHKYIGHFGLANPTQSYSYHSKDEDSKDGTLLHFMVTSGNCLSIELIQFLLNAGVDKTIKNSEGKVAYDCINFKFNDSQIQNLQEMLYVEGCNICYSNGTLYCVAKLSIVEKFKSYTEKGINAVIAYKTNDKEALDFFLSCGAELESIKAVVESEKRKKEITEDSSNYGYDDSYTEQDLRDMYRDAFDGFEDAEWNID